MKILFLQKRLLLPADTGGKIRSLNIIRHLARWHDVTYLSNVTSQEQSYAGSMQALGVRLETIPWRETPRRSVRFIGQLLANLFSKYPFNVNKDYDPRLRRRASQLLQSGEFDLLICDFVQMSRNAIGLGSIPKLLFQHNVESEIFRRHAENGTSPARRAYMRLQYRKMKRYEANAGLQFDRVVAVSRHDQNIFQQQYGWQHVDVIDTSVDTDYFQPQGTEIPDRVTFVGSLDWLPNEEGLRRFVSEAWPIVHHSKPNATLHIVGRSPSPAIKRLASIAGITVNGSVPDVRPHLGAASVVVVPLWVGGGTRLKIFEAFAMRKAVVSTTIGAEGLPVESGQHLITADEPDALARNIVALLNDPTRRQQMATTAERYVRDHFSTESVAAQFDRICQDVVGKASSAQPVKTVGSLSS